MKSLRIFAAFLLCAGIGDAQAQLLGSNGLDKSFCNTKSVRETVVYIDDSLMIENKTAWVPELIRKMKASLAPGERTVVVQLSPGSGKSTEIWGGCWPEYTPEQRAKLEKDGPYILKKNPLTALEEQQGFFARDFNAAVSKIYFETKRPIGEVNFEASKAPKKQLLRALASDEARFGNSRVTIRAIVYSDMIENSDLGSVFKSPEGANWVNYSEKLGTHLRRSVFYIYGVGLDVVNGPSSLESAKRFWTNALRSMSATVGGFGADLNVPNGIPVSAWSFDSTLMLGDQELTGKLSVLTDLDGNTVDSWIGFNRLSIAGLVGTFHCDTGSCKLDATTTSGLATDSPSEDVVLRGPPGRLTGTLGVKGAKNFSLTAVLPSK